MGILEQDISNLIFSQVGGEDEVYLSGDYIDAKFEEGGLEKFQIIAS